MWIFCDVEPVWRGNKIHRQSTEMQHSETHCCFPLGPCAAVGGIMWSCDFCVSCALEFILMLSLKAEERYSCTASRAVRGLDGLSCVLPWNYCARCTVKSVDCDVQLQPIPPVMVDLFHTNDSTMYSWPVCVHLSQAVCTTVYFFHSPANR